MNPALESFRAAIPDAVTGSAADAIPAARVSPEQLPAAAVFVRDGLQYRCFRDLTVIDDPARADRFELSYLFYSMAALGWFRLKAHTADRAPSITAVFPAASWYEREAFDLFGVQFDGHPALCRILLPDDWQGHPLRRDHPIGSEPVDFTVTRSELPSHG